MEHVPHETVPRPQRSNNRRTAMLIALAAVLLVGVGAGWWWKVFSLRVRGASPTAQVARWQARIGGMDCLLCAAGLQSQLRKLPGVISAEVSFQEKRATVVYDPLRTHVARHDRAIQGSGFKVAAASAPSRPPHSATQ